MKIVEYWGNNNKAVIQYNLPYIGQIMITDILNPVSMSACRENLIAATYPKGKRPPELPKFN